MILNKLFKCLGVALLLVESSFVMAENYVMGQLIPLRSVTISNEVTGVVDEFTKDIGDVVNAGDVLTKLSVEDNLLNVTLANAELGLSNSELEIQEKQLSRYQSLYQTKGVSASEYDEQRRKTSTIRAQVEVDKIKLRMAQRQQDKSEVKAPFSGHVITRNVELGQYIPAGNPLYTLIDMSQVKVRFYLLESDVIETKIDDKVRVTVPALPNMVFNGHITTLAPAFQANEPGFLVEVLLNNESGLLKPGMQARVKLDEKGVE